MIARVSGQLEEVRDDRVILSAGALACTIGTGGTLALLGRDVAGWSWGIAPALVGVALQVAVLSSVGVALATSNCRVGLRAVLRGGRRPCSATPSSVGISALAVPSRRAAWS